jgi:NADH:ubiquinone oxidoreductase subunit C
MKKNQPIYFFYSFFLQFNLPKINKIQIKNNELEIYVERRYSKTLMQFLSNNTLAQFTFLADLISYDRPEHKSRFIIIYHILSILYNFRIKVIIQADICARINSVSKIFTSAIWAEREAWDMLGIIFTGNNDLRRILTDYGFKGHPLRKDFSMSGDTELIYSEIHGGLIRTAVAFAQEYRSYS